MAGSSFVGYVGDADFHDGSVLAVKHQGGITRLAIFARVPGKTRLERSRANRRSRVPAVLRVERSPERDAARLAVDPRAADEVDHVGGRAERSASSMTLD